MRAARRKTATGRRLPHAGHRALDGGQPDAVDVEARAKDLNDLEDKVKSESEQIYVDRDEGGMHVWLDRVLLRDPTLSPEEILMSESQERMCAIVTPAKLDEFLPWFEDWTFDWLDVPGLIHASSTVNPALHLNGSHYTNVDAAALFEAPVACQRPRMPPNRFATLVR